VLTASEASSIVFVKPRSGLAVDVDAHIKALPANAMCKGMFFRDMLDAAEGKATSEQLATRAGVEPRRYVAFRDYPIAENFKLGLEVAKVAHPRLATGDAFRLLGRRSYVTLLQSHAARVLLAAVGGDVERVLLLAPKAMRLVLNFGHFHSERIAENCVHFRCESYPAFVETYLVGTLEGVFQHFGVDGEIKIAIEDIGKATFEARWTPRADRA
jgi:hypothetical protein